VKSGRQVALFSTAKTLVFGCRGGSLSDCHLQAYGVCMQKTCTQLYQSRLWKCPALAYFAMMERKLHLENIPKWQLFRDYKAISPDATNDELDAFIESKAIPQCALCPSRRAAFVHPNPLLAQ